MIIIILIIIFSFLFILNIRKKNHNKAIVINKKYDYEINKLNKKQKHKERIYLFLEFIYYFRKLNKEENLYSFDKSYNRFSSILDELIINRPNINEINISIRLSNFKIKKICDIDYILTKNDINFLYNFDKTEYYFTESLNYSSKAFENYWDNVLVTYKRIDFRKKRLLYLINYLNIMKEKIYIKNNNIILSYIISIKNKYQNQLSCIK